MVTKKDIRKQGRKRVKEWRQKRMDEGMKEVKIFLPSKVHELLLKLKSGRNDTNSTVIENALIEYAKKISEPTNESNYIKTDSPAKGSDFRKGDRVMVNNPRSKYHGRIMNVTGYDSKWNMVRGNIEGGAWGEFQPNQLEKLTDD